jgi:hypothetical protein
MLIVAIYDCIILYTVSRILSFIPILSKIEFNMIQIISIIETFNKIVISHFGLRKYGTYFPFMEKQNITKFLAWLSNIVFIIQIFDRNEKKQKVKHYELLSVIRCVKT